MAGIADVRGLPPGEFSGAADFTDAMINSALEEASLLMERESWDLDNKLRHDTGHALLAAHILVDGKPGGLGGARGTIVSERLGPASRSYAAPQAAAAGDDPLNLRATTYGRRFLALQSSLPLSPLALFDGVTGNPDA